MGFRRESFSSFAASFKSILPRIDVCPASQFSLSLEFHFCSVVCASEWLIALQMATSAVHAQPETLRVQSGRLHRELRIA
jgi:hypothetical protein